MCVFGRCFGVSCCLFYLFKDFTSATSPTANSAPYFDIGIIPHDDCTTVYVSRNISITYNFLSNRCDGLT